jgi:hypothetical protein
MPVAGWVDADFKKTLRETLLDRSSRIAEHFHPGAYTPWVEAFCEGNDLASLSHQGLSQRILMLLAVHLALHPAER